jgi:hypothetical protein
VRALCRSGVPRAARKVPSQRYFVGRAGLEPATEDYEHSGPERCAVRRIPLVKSEGRPPNTLLFRGSPLSKINYRQESPITRNVESLNIPSGPVRDVSTGQDRETARGNDTGWAASENVPLENWKTVAEVIWAAITSVAVLVGGIWAYCKLVNAAPSDHVSRLGSMPLG